MNDERAGPIVWTGILGATALLLFLLQQALWLVVPFLLGMILYYILVPVMQRLLRAGIGRDLAAVIVIGGFVAAFSLVAVFSFSWFVANVGSWQDLLGQYADGGTLFIRNTVHVLEQKFAFLHKMHLSDVLDAKLAGYTDNFAQQHLTDFLLTIASWLPSMLLAPFLTFFILRDGQRFKRLLGRAVPNAFFEKTLHLLHEVDQTARRYFQGLLKLTLIDTVVLALGLWAIGVSSPWALGLISAVLAWVPYVGSIMGCVMVVMVASVDAPTDPFVAYGAIGVFILARLLDDFVFMPLTLGRSLRIHPLITVLMIFVGGAVAGVAGLMLVLPLLGVVMVVGETVGRIVTNPRMRARHRSARALRFREASSDLPF